jgi:NAD(P)-dependent dehydrogenase (short-subunit alcohol dehydrogenase family)
MGAAVTLVARSEHELAGVAEDIEAAGGRAWARPADVCDESAVEAVADAAEREAPLSILVTAAGLNRPGPAADYDLADWDLLTDVNVRGTFIACRAVARRLIARGAPGRIITISSQMGAVGFPGRAAYRATKHAVNGLTKALAVEWAPHGITVNAVAPTFVRTRLTEPMLADPEFASEVARRIPRRAFSALDSRPTIPASLTAAGLLGCRNRRAAAINAQRERVGDDQDACGPCQGCPDVGAGGALGQQ